MAVGAVPVAVAVAVCRCGRSAGETAKSRLSCPDEMPSRCPMTAMVSPSARRARTSRRRASMARFGSGDRRRRISTNELVSASKWREGGWHKTSRNIVGGPARGAIIISTPHDPRGVLAR